MSDLSQPSAASNGPVLLQPGDFVVVKATGARVVVVGHALDRGTVTYRIAYPTGAEEGGSGEGVGGGSCLIPEIDRVLTRSGVRPIIIDEPLCAKR